MITHKLLDALDREERFQHRHGPEMRIACVVLRELIKLARRTLPPEEKPKAKEELEHRHD